MSFAVQSGAGAERTLSVAVAAAASALALGAASRPWGDLGASGSTLWGGPDLARGLALVGLAGSAALLLLGPTGRRAVAACLALSGAGIVAATVGTALRVGLTGWAAVTATAGSVLFAAGVWCLLRAGLWSAPSTRYERTNRTERTDAGAGRQLWDALDRGEDPTA